MIPPEEAEEVIATANFEGLAGNEYRSGKYKLGGDWVKKMPRSLAWFNQRLEQTIFPTIAALFPEIVSGPSVLRAHSVAILKYNASHPRTDVHVDDGVLAMTLALSPRANYSGGGTCHAALPPFIGTLFLARFLARLLGRTMSRRLELRARAAPRP